MFISATDTQGKKVNLLQFACSGKIQIGCNTFIYSFIQQSLFIIDLMCNTFAGSGPMDTMPACKEADQMSTTPFPASARHSEATFPSLPCSSVAMRLSTNHQNAGKSDPGRSQPWSIENLPYESLNLSPSSVCQAEAEDESQQRKEETQNGFLEDLTPSTDMEVPSEEKKNR